MYARLTGSPANLRQERVDRALGGLGVPGFIKGASSKMAAGFAAFYNCIRRHLGPGGDTPAKEAHHHKGRKPVGHTDQERVPAGLRGR